jgi:hypothetical protein
MIAIIDILSNSNADRVSFEKHRQPLTCTNEKVPLKSVDVSGEFFDSIGKVMVKQTYTNKFPFPIEASYSFNLDMSSVVQEFKMQIGEKKLAATIKEKNEAKQEYTKAVVTDKKKASLLEKISDSDYKVYLGNINEGETIIIEFTYLTETSMENGKFKFVLPSNIAPRYISGDSSSTEAIYSSDITYTSNINYNFNFDLLWQSRNSIKSVGSLSNGIIVADGPTSGTKRITCTTSPQKGDFNLLVTTDVDSAIYHYNDGTDDYLMISHQIPNEDKQVTPKIYYFVIDKSGSMKGSKMKQACDALILFLQSLPKGSYFNVISFGSDYYAMWDQSVPYTDDTLEMCLNKIKTYDADMGGTEIYACLRDSLKGTILKYEQKVMFASSDTKYHDELEKIYVILTDGQVSNVSQIETLLKSYNGKCRIFSIGIGNDASRELIETMANSTNGISKIVIDECSLGSIVIDMLDYVNKQYYVDVHPCINDTVKYTMRKALYPGDCFCIFVKLTGDEYEKLKDTGIVIKGKDPLSLTKTALESGSGYDCEWNVIMSDKEWILPVTTIYEGSASILAFYVKHEINALTEKYNTEKNAESQTFTAYKKKIYTQKQDELEKIHDATDSYEISTIVRNSTIIEEPVCKSKDIKSKIIDLSIKHHIMSNFTSYIIVDDVQIASTHDLKYITVPNYSAPVPAPAPAPAAAGRSFYTAPFASYPAPAPAPAAAGRSFYTAPFASYPAPAPAPAPAFGSLYTAPFATPVEMDFPMACVACDESMPAFDPFGTHKNKATDHFDVFELSPGFTSTPTTQPAPFEHLPFNPFAVTNLNALLQYKMADGSFKYALENVKFLGLTQKEFTDMLISTGLTDVMLFNKLVLEEFKKTKDDKYKLIIKNLENWNIVANSFITTH